MAALVSGARLTYFGMVGRGEAIRLAFVASGIPFEDQKVAFPEWGALKPNTVWGSLPVLTLTNGEEIGQSRAILRLVGKAGGLYPTDDILGARCDALIDAADDWFKVAVAAGQGMEVEAKLAARKECAETGALAQLLTYVEGFITKGGSPEGHTVSRVCQPSFT